MRDKDLSAPFLPDPTAVLRRALPASWFRWLRQRWRRQRFRRRLWQAYRYDRHLFERGGGLLGSDRPGVAQARILKSCHRLEKGLALRNPRPGFGIDAVGLLLDELEPLRSKQLTDWVSRAALQTLGQWLAFNGDAVAAEIRQRAQALMNRAPLHATGEVQGGTHRLLAAEIRQAAHVPFDAFLRARHSVRQFAARALDPAVLEAAVAQARFAPSVCNRSAGRVYLCTDRDRMGTLLAHQNGNRGFGEQAAALFIVTARQAAFHTVGERNQGWIDGALFGMTLVYALHAQGLGTCCLNWSVEPAQDRALKRAAGIEETDAVIMMVATGHLPDALEVACSARPPVREVLTWI
jgi:nitroreductase